MTASRIDLHQVIADKIVAAIAAGAGTFEMPWHRRGTSYVLPKNALTGAAYRGTNVLLLWMDADEKKFEHQVWATYRQWEELGAQVRKGEKSSTIVKYGEWTPKADREAAAAAGDDAEARKRLYARAAHVFNVDQVDGYAIAPTAPRADLTVRLAHVDDFVRSTGAEIREGGQRAFYRHKSALSGEGDFIQLPPRALFTGTSTSTPTEAYESTRLHELAHWTGAAHRLARQFGERFGDQAYAFEELVAELSAAYLCAELEITNTPRADHAQYIANWLQVLKDDKKAIFSAASLASRVVEYLRGLQPTAERLAA